MGRTIGTDRNTMRALRGRDGTESDRFPSDVLELHGYLTAHTTVPGVNSYPAGPDVLLFILGSSLFGAQPAATLGLPYAFASHFAPQGLRQAAKLYRDTFDPADVLASPDARPYFIAAVHVIATDDPVLSTVEQEKAEIEWLRSALGPSEPLSDGDLSAFRSDPRAGQILSMMSARILGTGPNVITGLPRFDVQADELLLSNLAVDEAAQHRTLELLAPTPELAPKHRRLKDSEITAASAQSVCIVGAGAMGIVTGYEIAEAGAEVTNLARPQ